MFKVIVLVVSILANDGSLNTNIFYAPTPEQNTLEACRAAKHNAEGQLVPKVIDKEIANVLVQCIAVDVTSLLGRGA